MRNRFYIFGLFLSFPLATASAADDWLPRDSAQLSAEIEKGDYGTVTSVLVHQRGNILYEQYFNGADATTLHNTRSATKTVAGMLVGAAIADGLIAGLNEFVTSFFPELQPLKNSDPRKDQITIEDFLTMSSLLDATITTAFRAAMKTGCIWLKIGCVSP